MILINKVNFKGKSIYFNLQKVLAIEFVHCRFLTAKYTEYALVKCYSFKRYRVLQFYAKYYLTKSLLTKKR